ncbi:hypothetical protein [Sporomusa acidovorans]|uniref:Uncharacterized protein n=1 Tax=Sporomusa acidovorans (strain ATCC 49682 / DSM 3132 / Mol) TaxID=1123286 RepID=A0ABZ3IXU1_SPOA4|nr:hypothetical protein [Sporomusa acidovorans]OZC23326.1 hypothetical protein SPACI_07380 [Sporomusa acidovorans DSM 3132]SDE41954.1 hypothetical protein SAMN04488499_101340 [Sporomusa acidovorans]
MSLQGVSAIAGQTAYGKQGQSSEKTDDNASGWRYLTVREGGRVYTYVVIGKNMRILIGEAPDEGNDQKDKKSADGSKNTAAKPDSANASSGNVVSVNTQLSVSGQNSRKEEKKVKRDFLTDTSMFALTGYYQKKMRETIDKLGTQTK